MTIRAVETEFFNANKRTDKRTEEWTDMKRLVIALRNFANAPSKHQSTLDKLQESSI